MKKFLIALIFIPAIALTIFLYLNKDTVGKPKLIAEKQFYVNEITCQSCVQKIKQNLEKMNVKLESYDLEKKTVTLKYDINKYSNEKLNKFLLKDNYSLDPIPEDKLEIIDYQIKYN